MAVVIRSAVPLYGYRRGQNLSLEAQQTRTAAAQSADQGSADQRKRRGSPEPLVHAAGWTGQLLRRIWLRGVPKRIPLEGHPSRRAPAHVPDQEPVAAISGAAQRQVAVEVGQPHQEIRAQ